MVLNQIQRKPETFFENCLTIRRVNENINERVQSKNDNKIAYKTEKYPHKNDW